MIKHNFDDVMKEFNKDIEGASKERNIDVNVLMLEAHRLLALRSPVDTGRFRASHQLSINARDLSEAPEGMNEGGYAGIVQKNINSAALTLSNHKLKDGDRIYIQNNLEYAEALENGHSDQAAHGVYSVTLQYIKGKLK